MRAPLAMLGVFAACGVVHAAPPNHPVLTEIYQDPPGLTDGPVGRDPNNLHQSFIELWLPTAAGLAPGLDADSLDLAIYEVEGDFTSSGVELVNYRIDLPTFDLDPTNGLTGLARPPSGVVVIGWVDYLGNPPTDLLGTPATRVALVNGGVTSTTDYTFIALNGNQFSGTSNFPAATAVSHIDLPAEATNGIVQNGSAAYLLVNRDDPGYVELYDDKDPAQIPPISNADPDLPSGMVFGVSALLDGFATNDHDRFDPLLQPIDAPSGDDIDLETVLPLGGVFSRLIPQRVEAVGQHRPRLDVVAKTTENATALDDDPVADALAVYRDLSLDGPLGFPTPGRVNFSTDPPELAVATPNVQLFDVLSGTIGRPGVLAANVGGDFAVSIAALPGSSSNPGVAFFASGPSFVATTGQSASFPQLEVAVPIGAAPGATATTGVSLSATTVNAADPPTINPFEATVVTARVVDPMRSLNRFGLPIEATTLAAVQGLPDTVALNEFLATRLARFVAVNLGGLVDDERRNGLLLGNANTDLSDPVLVDVMEDDLPDNPLLFINPVSASGTETLVGVILASAEQINNGTYDDNFNLTLTALRAIQLDIAETRTIGGPFLPTAPVHYADATGRAGTLASGLTSATTSRGFELALLDTNVQQLGTLETGSTDDFGLVAEVGRVRAGGAAVPGEFIALSFSGGLEGSDIDELSVPPGANQTVVLYFDLDPLDSVLGIETITRLFVVDGNGGSAVNVIEAFSLNVDGQIENIDVCGNVDGDDAVDAGDVATYRAFLADPVGAPLGPFADERCTVIGTPGPCSLRDVVVMWRALIGPSLPPGIAPVCAAAQF